MTMSNHPDGCQVLYVRDNAGQYVVASREQVIGNARAHLEKKLSYGKEFFSPRDAREYLMHRLSGNDVEVFTVMFLDIRHRLIACEDMFTGTLNGTAVHQREVARRALKHNAAAIIVAHNHLSGVPDPSRADEVMTKRLKEALSLVEVRLLDHIIVGAGESASFSERGLL